MDTPDDPDCYWVEPGRVLAGEYPGDYDPATARAKLRALLQCGIRTFVDLTEADEGLEVYDGLLEEEAAALGLTVSHVRMAIPDMGVPDHDGMRAILDTITENVENDTPVYVHCLGGIGRTGTVVACWLADRGLAGEDVVEMLARLRQDSGKRPRRSPETRVQFDFVRAWIAKASSERT